MKTLQAYYGASILKAWWSGFRERRAGLHPRANARWGWLRPPAGRGPALWLQASAREEDVLLGAELARAIREKRLDLRIVLTFEEEYPALVEPRMRGLKGVGYGYGPCDHPRAVRRTISRLHPLRILTVGRGPQANLARQSAQQGIASVCIAGDPCARALPEALEAVYPLDSAQAARWREVGADQAQVQAPVDFLTLLVTAQVDPNFRRYICGPAEFDLWWLAGVAADEAARWVAAWRAGGLADNGVLFLSVGDGLDSAAGRPISAWDREPVAAGTVFRVDDPKWLPAIAAASTGIHLQRANRFAAWQAMASGKPVTVADAGVLPLSDFRHLAAPATIPDAPTVMRTWAAYLDDPIAARKTGDAMRRLFWETRRHAQNRLPELLQRVFDW